ncbi:MAG: molybdopterin-dependent oxidoreductase [Pseudomonadota bacterium]
MKTTDMLTHWGPLRVTGDRRGVVGIADHPADPDPSPLSRSLRQAHECRIARPAIRRGWLEDGPGAKTDRRGLDAFVEVPWDEALDLVAVELRRVKEDHGHPAIFAGSYGWGSSGRFHAPSSQLFRFMRQFGGCTDVWGTYSSSAANGILPYVFGMPYYASQGQQTSWSVIARHTELFVTFGGLRLTNAQVSYTGQGPHLTREWMGHSTANGLEFLNVSPLRDDIDTAFSPRWLHPRPGTDVALMLGLIHTLVSEGLHDKAFVDRYCHGWPAFERYVMGTSDGTPKSAAWAAEITGLHAPDIAALSREMARKRTLINVTFAVQRQDHGEQPYWMGVALAAALGQIGLPGGGFAFAFGSAGFPGGGQPPRKVPGLPIPKRPEGCPTISVSRIVELLEAAPGEILDFNGERTPAPDTRLVYWCGGNIWHHHQDLNRLRRAWQRPETIIVHEPFWNPMSKHADIVLPSTMPLERLDLGQAETLLIAMQPVLEPYEESRDDYAILAGIADRLGFGAEFSEGRSAREWVEHLYEQFRTSNNQAPPFDEFLAAGTLTHDMPRMGEPRQVFLEQFRSDPDEHALPTPSGRIELFSETIAAYGYDDCPGHPAWLEPYERLGMPAADQHPLHLISNQPTGRLHSQFDHGEASTETKIHGREPCRMHPNDAAQRGLADGDVVRIYNDRGACLAGVELSDALMPGVVQLSTGAWYDPDATGLCVHGNPNVLTRDKGTSRLSQGPSAHTCLVQVEAWTGELPPVTAFDPPPLLAKSELG